VQSLGEPIHCAEKDRYRGVILDTQHIWFARLKQLGKKAAQRLAVLGPLLVAGAACESETVCCSTSSLSVLRRITLTRCGGPLPVSTSESYICYNVSVFALRLSHFNTLVTGKFIKIWRFHFSPMTSEYKLSFDSKLADVGNPL
jgi:hypothetical protein